MNKKKTLGILITTLAFATTGVFYFLKRNKDQKINLSNRVRMMTRPTSKAFNDIVNHYNQKEQAE